ncbi:glycine betaine ABC transporter substrate-binding protein [Nocardia blacklockiae]|uniref:glycine betaine ABC transporter substrate-binding protein n=1 Tax=Nocardia blacklockiae TaxID=480036 RepID=UPI001894DBEA|nr:glycine betaine ABC transporter substrate-binding protein [Nocardia blacklockiae]MBF6174523.1 transporter [Nocardia blacklockiae]
MELAASVRMSARAMIAVLAAGLVVSCSDGGAETPLAVGAGDSAQSELMAEIYAGALARSGAHTVTRPRLGGRGDYLAALDAGTVQLVADDSGDLLSALDSGSRARLPDKLAAAAVTTTAGPAERDKPAPDVSDGVSRALPEGLAVSDIADGTDLRPAFVLAPAHAQRFPDSLAELGPHCGELTVGIATGGELDPLRPPRDPQRDVLDPLRTAYGCDIVHHSVYPNDSELRKALQDGHVQAGVLTAPAALLPGGVGDLVPIADPDYAFRAQSVLPLFRKGALSARQIKQLNKVAGELTTAELTEYVRRLRDEHTPAAELARSWLDAHDL